MIRRAIALGSLWIGVGIAPPAEAACGLSILASDLNLEWDLNWTSLAVSVQVDKVQAAECTFGLGFTQGVAGSYTRYASSGTANLNYQLYQDSNKNLVLKTAPDIASANDVLMVTMPTGGGPQIELYYFDIPFATATSPALVPAGVYTDSFVINAYEGTDPATFADPPDASTPVNVTITVPKLIGLALVDTGGVFQDSATAKSIHFGSLYQGKLSRFDMRVRTNAGYQISVASTNGGLKHATTASSIPYTMTVNGVTADLSGAVPVLTSGGQTALSGLGYPVRIEVGAIAGLPLAGTYQDTVVITATTTD